MPTVNKRVGIPQAAVINGVDSGGLMTARIDEGYENVIRSAPDGLEVPMLDREVQYCRGSITTQDWPLVMDLLTGVVGTYVFYERKSGTAVETGFIEHTITLPVIHRCALRIVKGQYGGITFDFECRAEDDTKGIADMHALADAQAAPTYIPAARGAYRISTAVHGAQSIYHVTAFDLTITLPLVKACNDADVGYTCVDARLSGLTATGSLTFQDATIATSALVAQTLLVAARAALVLTATQGGGVAAKTITIAGVIFTPGSANSDVNADFTEYTLSFEVSNDTTTQLTLAGDNKILTIADVE